MQLQGLMMILFFKRCLRTDWLALTLSASIVVFSPPGNAAGSVKCANLLRQDYYANGWIFTDPKTYNPKSFAFSVYGLRWSDFVLTDGFLDDVPFDDILSGAHSRIGNQKILSVSIITEKKTATYGSYGFIISPPKDREVIAAWWKDFGTLREGDFDLAPGTDIQTHTRALHSDKQMPFSEVAEKTSVLPHRHNEIVIDESAWKLNGGQVIGLFYKVSQDGERLVHPKLLESLGKKARELDLPLVEIPQRSKDLNDTPIRITDRNENSAIIEGVIDGTAYKFRFWRDGTKIKTRFESWRKNGSLLNVSDRAHYAFFVRQLRKLAEADFQLRELLIWAGLASD